MRARGALGAVAALIAALSIGVAGVAATPSWQIQATLNPGGGKHSQFRGVSCPTATACTAVGSHKNHTMAERWNGSTWAIQAVPNPAGATSSQLIGVSCPTASVCTAVGSYTTSAGGLVTLAERWNGSRWAVQATSNPAGAILSMLFGVSCPSAGVCTAVGSYNDSADTTLTLAERWNGSSWAIQATHLPAGAKYSEFAGVSCSRATACTAVGDYGTNAVQKTLAERWNGSSWAFESTPTAGANFSRLLGVSCPTVSACTAVGAYFNDIGPQLTLAERWNGSRWAIQATPNPDGSTDSALSGVSCPTAGACAAVGVYVNSATDDVTLADGWNGSTWAIQSTPNPAGATFSLLTAASCTVVSACTAVGEYFPSGGSALTLAERYS